MQLRRLSLATFLLGATALSQPALSQDNRTTLDTIVITASRTDLPTRAVGSAATVVDRDRVVREQNRRVTDALRDVPGVQVSQDRPGVWTSISIRGSDNDQVLVLVDGVRVADPSAASTAFQFDHLSAADIERIEVLRGNQSSLYGSDAIGGVINIITRRADTDGWRLSADAEVGPHRSKRGNATLMWKHGAMDARLTAYSTHYDGPPIKIASNVDSPYRGNGISAVLGWQIAPATRLEFSGMTSDTWSAYDSRPGGKLDTVDKDEWRAGLRLTHETADGRWRHALHAGRYSAVRSYHTGHSRASVGDVYDGLMTSLGYDVTWKPNDTWSVVGGLARETEKTRQATNFSGDFIASNRTTAAFAEIAYTPDDRNTVTLALRRDDNDRFGSFETWRVTGAHLLSYGQTDIKLRASAGTGAKSPSLYQLFDPTYGNPNLTAQESRGFDLGADVYLPWGELNATLFRNQVSNKIAWGDRPGGTKGYYNLGATLERGLELGLSAELAPNWTLAASHTYLLSQNDLTGAWRGMPKHTGTFSVTYAADPWSVTGRLRYASGNDAATVSGWGKHVSGYGVVDLFASHKLSERTELYGRIESVFDRRYETYSGYRTPERSLYAGIRIGLEGK
ncbi:TonB-dependent receptor plug domain-containing protein [Paracoccus sp. p4-l81]|uniref:TonB-dependent receptor plug domain-containing protein n=1 Tax=Paracoccus sp. p4-l81 TaxID=3342806 RepID=UPI0035B8425A